MRQVPSYAVIGNGALARHLQHYFKTLGIPFSFWHRGMTSTLNATVSKVSHVLLLLSDDVLATFYNNHHCLHNKIVIHCSGACSIPGIYSAHPLMTFGPELYTLIEYQRIPFVMETADLSFNELFPALPNPSYTINANQKKLYHALCVLAGNFSCMLWQKLFAEFENKLKLPSTAAKPYLEQVTKNLIKNPTMALTGPLVRQDKKTIQSHLDALQGDVFHTVYQAFVQAYQPPTQEGQ